MMATIMVSPTLSGWTKKLIHDTRLYELYYRHPIPSTNIIWKSHSGVAVHTMATLQRAEQLETWRGASKKLTALSCIVSPLLL